MKIRSGFVSNSSSSSFIIAIDKSEECPHCKRKDPNFLDFLEKIGRDNDDFESTHLIARGSEATINWWKDNVSYDETEGDKEWDEIFKKIKDAESSGKEVGTGTISYHDDIANCEYYQQKRSGTTIEIWGDH